MMDNEALNTARVLVVDDEPQMRSIVTFAMETKGFHTATASSAPQPGQWCVKRNSR